MRNVGEKIREIIWPSLEVVAEELDKFSGISSGFKLKVEMWTTAALLEKYENSYDEVQAVKEAVHEIHEGLKELQEKELEVEERLLELRRFWNITIMKPLLKRSKMERKKAKREQMERKKLILELNREIVDLKRKVRQEHIMQIYQDDPLLKVAEGECIEILKSSMNVD